MSIFDKYLQSKINCGYYEYFCSKLLFNSDEQCWILTIKNDMFIGREIYTFGLR